MSHHTPREVQRLTLRVCAAVMTPVALAALLTACGGGTTATGASSTTTTTTAAAATSFPTGLAVGSPTDVGSTTTTASMLPWDGVRFAADWGRAAWQALRDGDGQRLARLAAALVPAGSAYAGSGGKHEIAAKADEIEKVLNGDSAVDLGSVLNLGELFGDGEGNDAGDSEASANAGSGGASAPGTPASGAGSGTPGSGGSVTPSRFGAGRDVSCYGPQMKYENHQDFVSGTPGASGELPSGDLGLWKETLADGTPCVAAQLRNRVKGVKQKTNQALLLTAAMRRTIASASLSMPTAGNTTDLTSAFQTRINALSLPFAVTVEAATVALNGPGTVYTYRVVLKNALTGLNSKRGEVIMTHTPGADATSYSGVLQVAGFYLGNDAAFGCSDQTDSSSGASLYKTSQISTIKYSRAGAAINFGSRFGEYCGHPTSSGAGSNLAVEVAGFTSDGQLDPGVKVTSSGPGTPARGSTLGWRGNFTRFGGAFDKDTVAGNFLLAWQAGTGDSHARALAANADYNSVSGDLTVKGFFGYAGTVDASSATGQLVGMICNWAGPGNSHGPQAKFQSQTAVKTASSSKFVLSGTSKIGYAPTNSCDSTTTRFDQNLNGVVGASEGAPTTNTLDVPASGQTVHQTLTGRGYSQPSFF